MLSFKSSLSTDNEAFVIFVTEKYQYKDNKGILQNNLSNKIDSYIKLLEKKNVDETISSFDISSLKKCFIVKVKNNFEDYYPQEIGGSLFSKIKQFKHIKTVEFYLDSLNLDKEKYKKFFPKFIFGFNLKSYTFDKYKTLDLKKNNKNINYKIITSNKRDLLENYKYFDTIKEGVFLTRDLVSEPPNVLNPKNYVSEIQKLSRIGLKVKVYNEKELKKLGMNALLGVGQGSENESFLVSIEWNGKKKSNKSPLAFVGKGVCFDTGGISLKPARFMEEMKYDMAGSAVVVGLLKSLALQFTLLSKLYLRSNDFVETLNLLSFFQLKYVLVITSPCMFVPTPLLWSTNVLKPLGTSTISVFLLILMPVSIDKVSPVPKLS